MKPSSFAEMLNDLESSRLEVVLVPAPRPKHENHFVRCAVSKNCKWYRDFCDEHASGRVRKKSAPDTRIRRANILRILGRLAKGETSRSFYVFALSRIAEKWGAKPETGGKWGTMRLFG